MRDSAQGICAGATIRLTFGAPGFALVASLMSLLYVEDMIGSGLVMRVWCGVSR